MKKFLALTSLVLATVSSSKAFAQDTFAEANLAPKPTWVCSLEFKGRAEGFQIIVGSFTSRATGTLRCDDQLGNRHDRQVRILMQTEPLSPTVGFGSFSFAGGAANILVVNSSPRALYGDYVVAQGRAAIVGGVGAFTALHVGARDLTLDVSLQVLEGFGVEAGFTKLSIERM